MLILAFESSCDETAVAVVEMSETTRRILSSEVATQVATHALYGGVVPEIASRAHTEAISSLTKLAMTNAGVTRDDIDVIAVTASPGLIGALLVGVNFAKGLASAWKKPLVPVNHVKGHAAAAYLAFPELNAPFFALIASGGHTSLTYVKSPTEFVPVARTRDDAAGEAFDKVARVIGLPYPGGAEMDRLASLGDPEAIELPSAAIDGSLDFSFSGIKTAVLNYANGQRQKGTPLVPEDIAASFTRTVTRSIVKQLAGAYEEYHYDTLVLAGGVAANSHLRDAVSKFAEKKGIKLCLTPKHLCGDNAAMIAVQGYFEAMAGNFADASLNAKATQGKSVF